MYDYSKQTYCKVGDRFKTEMPYSEVCMSMRVAGTVLEVELVQSGSVVMAQLYKDGKHFSFPITKGEAGVYEECGEYYYYPPIGTPTAEKDVCSGCLAVLDEGEEHAGSCPRLEETY